MENKYDSGVDSFGAGKVLGNLIVRIDKIKYNKSGKDHKAVDRAISDLLTKMEEDAKSNKFASLILRADNLSRELDQSRRYGKDAFTKEEREAMDIRAVAFQSVYDSLTQIDDVEKQQSSLIELAAHSSEERRQELRENYNRLDMERVKLKSNIDNAITKYNTAACILNLRAIGGIANELELSAVCDFKALLCHINEIVRNLEPQMTGELEYNTGSVTDVRWDDYSSGMFEKLVNSTLESKKLKEKEIFSNDPYSMLFGDEVSDAKLKEADSTEKQKQENTDEII